ncbi:MAG: M16 family metallopeptidase, partial [Rhodocyclaceae bacterium]
MNQSNISNANENLNIQFWKTTAHNVPVYFVSHQDLPMIDIAVNFNAGTLLESADKAGLASFTNSMLDKGTNLYDENSLDEALADLGAELSFPTNSETNSVRLRSLTNNQQNFQKGLDILINVLTKPKFDEKILQREIGYSVFELTDALTRPNVQVARTFNEI